MTQHAKDLCINLDDFRQVSIRESFPLDETQLDNGEVMIAIDRVALTANSVSYALAGRSGLMRFLDVFPAPEGEGRIPCWGYGEVLFSKHPEVNVGERVYGFFPVSSHIIVSATAVTAAQFTDGQECRKVIAPFYSEYQYTRAQPGYNAELDSLVALFQPLFMTSFLLENYLIDHDFYGADQVVVTSASSKTAMGFGYLLKKNHGEKCKTVGLTSPANLAFVKSLNCFDQVLSYGETDQIDANASTALFDVAGNAEVQRNIHQCLGEKILYSGGVGKTHWDDQANQSSTPMPGPAPVFWSGPDQLMKMRGELGETGFMTAAQLSMQDFLATAMTWIKLDVTSGDEDVKNRFISFLDGGVGADEGCILSFKKESL